MSRKLVALVAALSVGLVPATVAQGKRSADDAPKTEQHAKKPGKVKKVMWKFRGTVAAVDAVAGTVTIQVADKGGATNRHARSFRGESVVVSVKESRLVVADLDGDGARTLADVVVGDSAKVQARLPRRASLVEQPVTARHMVVKHPAPAPAGDDDAPAEQPAG